jgi:hypothetical protein
MNSFSPDTVMLHDYIQNKLSAEQAEQVELWLADNPQVMQDLQMDLLLKQGLEQIHADDKKAAKPRLHLPGSAYFNRIGMAFLLVLAFFLGGLTVHYFDEDTGLSFTNPEILMLSTNRGADTTARLNLHQNTVLQIPVSYLSSDAYAIELMKNSQRIYRLDQVLPQDDLLTVLIPEALIDAGLYQLEVTNQSTQKSERFDLEVR